MAVAASPRRRVSQCGGTLVEALLAIAILSILLLGVMAALTTTATVSRSTGQIAATRSALSTVIERAGVAAYPGCDAAGAVDTRLHDSTSRSLVEAPDGYGFEVVAVASAHPQAASCQASTSAVLVTIRVSHLDSGEALDGQVVIRDRGTP